jgi:hypothetical protein
MKLTFLHLSISLCDIVAFAVPTPFQLAITVLHTPM